MELIIFIAVVITMAGWAIRERKRASMPPRQLEHTGGNSNLDRYHQAGYRYSREMIEDLIDGAALVEQRKSGRHLGPDTHIYVNLGYETAATDFETVNHARWLEKFGARNGVYLHAMDGNREMSAAAKNKILYGG